MLTIYLFAIPHKLDFSRVMSEISRPFHQFCLNFVPFSPYRELYAALTCGQDLPGDHWQTLFQQTGLYHVLVVSGAHLIFISRWLRPLLLIRYGFLVSLSLLAIYVLMCQGQPPIVRAWIQLLLITLARHQRWNWRGPEFSLIAGLACLSVFPSWIDSRSFWLSWAASLATGWALQSQRSHFKQVFTIHGLLLPAAFSLGAAHPLCLILNWLIAPALGNIMLPLSLASMVIPWFAYLGDLVWFALEKLLSGAATISGMPGFFIGPPAFMFYVLALQFLWMISSRQRARRA